MTSVSARPTVGRRPVHTLVSAVIRAAPRLRPRVEKLVWRLVYEAASLGGRDLAATMNYGHADADASVHDPEGREDFGLRLYAAVAGAADLVGKDVLEVGCGRGGGASFVFQRFRPRSMTGIDLARTAIRRCRAQYARPGLEFMRGSAEDLPFSDAVFDAVISVESTHCYPDVPAFFAEVHRVLRPGGVFMLADLRRTVIAPPSDPRAPQRDVHGLKDLHAQLAAAGFRMIEQEDITANVTRALALNTPRLRARIERRVPKPLQRHALEFAAIEGSAIYRDFSERRLTYMRFLLQRP